jgi:fatty acid desaturase
MRLPSMSELGSDLLLSTPRQRWMPIPMPYFYASGFMVSWHFGVHIVSFLCLICVFSACSTSTHDVVHRSLGHSRRATEWLLFLLGLPILESGHAYRATHLAHHKRFPHHDDPEGEAAHQPVWKVLVSGPLFLPRLWIWAWRASENRVDQRWWLAVEAFLPVLGIGLGILFLPWSNAVLAYSLVVLVSSWFYPLFAVHLPHRHFEEGIPLRQAWTVRGRFIPQMFLPLAYHLEHHLYPLVPSHNLPILAQRLQPWLDDAGVEPVRVL